MSPLKLNFDGKLNEDGSDTVRFPRLSQGAPYSFGLRIRLEDGVTYRDWDDIEEIRWRIKARPGDKQELMVLLKSAGNFLVDSESDTLTFVVKATDWEGVELGTPSMNFLEMDVPFAHVVEFLDGVGGVVTERFASGYGLITVSLDF